MTYDSDKKRIMTRKEAKEAGLPRFFSGKPCLRGHLTERHTSSNQCVECARLLGSETRKAVHRVAKHNEIARKWARENPEKRKKRSNKRTVSAIVKRSTRSPARLTMSGLTRNGLATATATIAI